jgi:hypothetical protein
MLTPKHPSTTSLLMLSDKEGVMGKRLWLMMVALFVFTGILSAKPKMKVQLYGERFENGGGISWVYVYLILPNGDHAQGMCGQTIGQPSCTLESFAPEKRKPSECTLPNKPSIKMTCYESEMYEADRKKNDITLYGGSGKVTYHIYGSW